MLKGGIVHLSPYLLCFLLASTLTPLRALAAPLEDLGSTPAPHGSSQLSNSSSTGSMASGMHMVHIRVHADKILIKSKKFKKRYRISLNDTH